MMNSLNLLKTIESEFFEMKNRFDASPSLLEDITIRSLYDSLMNVLSVQELEQWMAGLEKTELSAFEQSFHPENSRNDDCFGTIHTLLMSIGVDQLEDVVFLIRKLKESDFSRFYYKQDVDKCLAISKAYHKESPNTVVLFRQNGGQYAVFAEDADMLYKQCGWELSTIQIGKGKSCDFLIVYPRGYEFLRRKNVEMVVMNCDYPIDFNVTNHEALRLSDSQQTIDCFRSLIALDKLVSPSMGLSYCPVVDGLETEERFPFMFKDRDNFGLYGEDGDTCFLIKENVWELDYEKVPLITNLAFRLSLIMVDDEKLRNTIDPVQLSYERARSFMLLAEYTKHKQEHPDSILLMRSGNLAWTFMEDALELTRFEPHTIWKIEKDPVVFLNLKRPCSPIGKSLITVVDSEMEVSFDKLRLQPHALNLGVRSSVLFFNPRIFKTKSGDYAIQAEVGDRTVPMIRISNNLSEIVLNYPDGIMRKTLIRAILFHSLHERYPKLTFV